MKVLLASPGLGMGGAEKVVLQLAEGLNRRGHEVVVSGSSGPLEPDVEALGVGRVVLPERGRSLVGAADAVRRLAAAVHQQRPDVVHGHNVKASVLAATAARIASPARPPRLVATFHGVVPGEYRAAARLLRAVDVVACVSGDLEEGLRAAGYPPARTRVVHNAMALPAPLSIREREALDRELGLGDAPVVAVVGRLVEQKNHRRLLEAIALVRDRGVDARWLVVGDGALRAALEERATELGLRRDVSFLGLRRDAAALMARADLLVFSSDWEGLSIAALEGLAAGTPIATTPVEGMRALLGDGRAGRIAAEMSAEALADTVVALLEDPVGRRAMGDAGRALVGSRFALDAMLDAYERLYQRS